MVKYCQRGCRTSVRSQRLRELVAPGQHWGYDLIVWVGLSRYRTGRQRDEIRQTLLVDHGIRLSAGTVSALCDRFLAHLECLHFAHIPDLRAAQEGGYPLHIDATCERGRGGLFVCVDGWRGWVLWADRIPSERGDCTAPIVEEVVRLFGPPVATVRDMGEGMAGAVKSLQDAGIPDLICHYHFVAAVGKQLFDSRYADLRGIIRQANCRADLRTLLRDLRDYAASHRADGRYGTGTVRDSLKALVLWVLQGEGRSDPPFPFALPHLEFARRCQMAAQRAGQWVLRPRTEPERRAVDHLLRIVGRLQRDPRLTVFVGELDERWAVFSELREVLRLTKAELPRGDTRYTQKQLPALELARLKLIEAAVKQYNADLAERVPAGEPCSAKPKSAPEIVLRYFKRYGSRLFGHPALLDEEGRILAIVERTNNVEEHLFGRCKQLLRRRVGRAHLARDLEQQPPQVALVDNLRHPGYVRIICGSIDNLPTAFAKLDLQSLSGTAPLRPEHPNGRLQRLVRRLHADPRSSTDAEHDSGLRVVPPGLIDIDSGSLERARAQNDHSPDNRRPAVLPREPALSPFQASVRRDPRLPPPGSVLERWHNGREYRVLVGDHDFAWGRNTYTSLTPIARQITKTSGNGFSFFGLTVDWHERAARMRGRRISRSTLVDLPRATES